MTIEAIPPGLVLIAGGLLLPVLKPAHRSAFILLLPVFVLWLVWQVPDGVSWSARFMGYDIEPLKGDRLSRLFGTVFSIMAFAGALYAYRQARLVEMCSAFVYAGAALGVVFAGDLITLFVYWELMALASTMVIWSAGTPAARAAGMRYMAIHLLGGVVLMVGVTAYALDTGGVGFDAMRADSFATWMILAGFLLNAGAPPLSAWLPDAYPEASPSGTVFLSAFTTKTAVYVLLRGFPGNEILIFIGVWMIFYGIIYALLENDMRRILAYSIVNQVGFMVTGAGIGTELAINGAAAHAFTHIIYKALLMMSAGSVLTMTGKRKCSDLGGLVQTMPFTAACGIVGALAISAFPLTSGFVSKSMISSAAGEQQMLWLWLALAAASAGVFLHAGIKFPWFVFFQKDSGLRPPEPPINMRLAMGLFAFLCLALGIVPGPLYALLPYAVDYVPYTGSHVVEQLQLLLFAGLAFFVMLPMMKRTETLSLDFDWFYRRFGYRAVVLTGQLVTALRAALSRAAASAGAAVLGYFTRYYGASGVMATAWTTRSMLVLVMALLAAFLFFYYYE